MDSLKLNMVAVDQIHPLLSDLMQALNKVSSLPADFDGKMKIRNWYDHHRFVVCVCVWVGAGVYFCSPCSGWSRSTR